MIEEEQLRLPSVRLAPLLFWARAVAAGWLIGGSRVAGIVLGASLMWEMVVETRRLWGRFKNQA